MNVRTVLFDLDGTLVDSAPAVADALSIVRLRRGAAKLSVSSVRAWISLGASELMRLALEDVAGDPEADLSEFRALLTASPTPADSLYPGVCVMIEALHDVGLALAVVTNKPETLARNVLLDLGILGSFREVIGGDTTEHAKPHPAPLLAALRSLDSEPREAVFVGDSSVDAAAAKALQIPFYFFEGGYGSGECSGLSAISRFKSHVELAPLILSGGA